MMPYCVADSPSSRRMSVAAVAMLTRSTYVMRYIRQSSPRTTVVACGFFIRDRDNITPSARGLMEARRLMEGDVMDETEGPTVEQSLEVLSVALGKATEDLSAVRAAVDRVRVDMSTHNGSHSRTIIRDAERAVSHLRDAEASLKDVLKDLSETQ